MRRKGRPYPPDTERRKLVRIELAKRDMTISDLASALGIHRGNVNDVINGTRLSPKTEQRIASFLDLPVESLFPQKNQTPREQDGHLLDSLHRYIMALEENLAYHKKTVEELRQELQRLTHKGET